jgi:hypothetical protein
MKIDSKGVHCQVVSHPLRRLSRSRYDSAVALGVARWGEFGGAKVWPILGAPETRTIRMCSLGKGRVLARLAWAGEIEGAMECQPHHAPGGGRKVKGKGDNWVEACG